MAPPTPGVDRVKKCKDAVVKIKKPGPVQVLTPEEEAVLARQCILLEKVGFPISDEFLQDEVKNILDKMCQCIVFERNDKASPGKTKS